MNTASWSLIEASRANRFPDTTPLHGKIVCDVCIVGGGYTGLWTAILLKQSRPDLLIALIEQEVCGFGASGSNGGCVLTLATKFLSLAKQYGTEEAVRLAQASEKAVNDLVTFCQLHQIDCELRLDVTSCTDPCITNAHPFVHDCLLSCHNGNFEAVIILSRLKGLAGEAGEKNPCRQRGETLFLSSHDNNQERAIP